MLSFPPMPTGCVIDARDDFDGPTLSWQTPGGRGPRLFAAGFLAFWLCGWAFGEISVGKELLAGRATLFHWGWLGAWTLGGGAAMLTLWAMLRPVRPESITLGEETFRHDPGSFALNLSSLGQSAVGNGLAWPLSPLRMLFPPKVVAAKADLGKFVLDRVGERQRLSIDRGADRIEIGAALCEPER